MPKRARLTAMKNIITVSHTVRDYSAWRIKFDENENARQLKGIRTVDTLVDADDEHRVTVLLEVSDLPLFKEFINSRGLRELMDRAGVMSKPEVNIMVSKN